MSEIQKIPIVDPLQALTKKDGEGMDWEQMEREAFIDVEKTMPRQPVAISIGEMSRGGNFYPIPLGSYGDYSCIVGPSKSKKTFFKSAVAAGYIGGKSNFYFEQIKGHQSSGKYVIDIDTEQGKYHSQLAFKRVVQMTGANTEYYRPYALRTYSPDQRVQFIDWLIYKSPFKGKIGLILIDGFADLLYDFNDLNQSQELQTKLLQWSQHANCHITGVLHRNFGSAKPVGHIGSAVLKKAETVVFLERDENEPHITNVVCEYSRNPPFENFAFEINNEWLPTEAKVASYEYNGVVEEDPF